MSRDEPAGRKTIGGVPISQIQTRWQVVRGLTSRDPGQRDSAWREFLDTYRPSMVAFARGFLRRAIHRDVGVARADEIVGDFTAEAVEKGWMARANPLQGQFRAYLQTLLHRYCCGWLDHWNAKKRRPPPGTRLLDAHDDEAGAFAGAPVHEAKREFDRVWASVVITRAVEALRAVDAPAASALDDLLSTAKRSGPLTSTERGRRRTAIEKLRPYFAAALRDTVGSDLFFEDEWAALSTYLPTPLRP